MTTPAKPGAATRPVYLELPGRLRVHHLAVGHAGAPVVLLHGGGVDAAGAALELVVSSPNEAGPGDLGIHMILGKG